MDSTTSNATAKVRDPLLDVSLKHLMLDTETFAKDDRAGVYSVGLVLFSLDSPSIESKNIYIKPSDILKYEAFTTERDTLKFSFETNLEEIYKAEKEGKKVKEGFQEVADTIAEWSPSFIWSNSPRFDMPKIEHAFSILGIKCKPLFFKYDMDVRTCRSILGMLGLSKYTNMGSAHVAHNAVDDCLAQIADVRRFFSLFPKEESQ